MQWKGKVALKVRLLFRDYEISDTNKQQLLYGVAVLVSILSVFSIIFMLSYYSDAPVDGAFPSGTPSTAFTQQNQTTQDPRVAGAQTQNQQMQPPPTSDLNPPSPKPSPSAKPSPSPSTEPTATPTPSPSPSPSPTPTQEPNHNPTPTPTPDNRPRITNITESDKTETSIKLKFSVDKSSDCKAIYWSDLNDKKEQESSTKRTTSPEITLTDLTASTEYTYNIECKDTENNQTSSISEYKFKTN